MRYVSYFDRSNDICLLASGMLKKHGLFLLKNVYYHRDVYEKKLAIDDDYNYDEDRPLILIPDSEYFRDPYSVKMKEIFEELDDAVKDFIENIFEG